MMALVIGAMANCGRRPTLRIGLADVYAVSGEEF
jgi:hypothetical protein